jgi:peptide/nickel transport system substrate-binding protein
MRSKTVIPVAAAVAMTSALLAGCAGGSGASASAGASVLTVAEQSAPLSLDPAAAANGNNSVQYMTPAYASLIGRDAEGNLIPALATKWGYVGDDYKRFEVTLRSGAKFADGTPVTAADVVASADHYRQGSGPGSPYFKTIKVTAEGTDKVVYTSATPNPSIPTLLTAKWMGGDPISQKGLSDPKALTTQTFGAGPYELDASQSVQGDHYVYVPNKYYWDQSAIHYKKIVIRVIAQTTSELEALKSGQIDAMYADASTATSAESASGLKVLAKPVSVDGVYLMDRDGTVTPALKDVRVRQALNYAIDRQKIVKAIYGKYGEPTAIPNVNGGPSYGADPSLNDLYPYDPAKAKQLLTAAGYPNGFTMTVLDRSSIPNEDAMLQAVASQLAEIGVKLKLKPESTTGAWVGDLVSKKYPATGQNTSGKPAVLQLPYIFLPGGIMNPFNATDAAVQAAEDKLLTASSDQEQALATAAMKTTMEQAQMVPVVATDDIFIYNSNAVDGVDFMTNEPLLTTIETWRPKS